MNTTDSMRRFASIFTALVACSAGCSDSGPSNGNASAGGGMSDDGGSGGDATSSGGSMGGNAGEPNSSGGASGGDTSAGAGGGGAFSFTGVCGQRGEGVVNENTFEGFEELYMVGEEEVDEGILDIYICAVRFTATRVGDAPGNCAEFAGQQDECLWTHLVEYSDPEIVTDEDGICANSELALDDDAIAAIDGSQAAYGFVSEYQGHNSVLLKYDEASDSWIPNGNATWDPDSGEFQFDRRDGYCDY